MLTGPGDELVASAAGRGRLRASHADREQVIGILKAAFVQGVLAKDEFDLRVSQAFASRTHAELAAVTADLPAEPIAAKRPEPARARGEQPVLRPGQVIMAATALDAAVWAFTFLRPEPRNPGSDPPHAIVMLFFSTNLIYLLVLAIAVGFMIAGWREKRSSRRPPQRPAPGAGGQESRRPPSADPGRELPPADPGRELPPADRGHQHTAEAERSHPPRPPGRARGYRGDGAPSGCLL